MRHKRLLDWYDRHHRDLPWRQSRDPYRIWLSEVMLQQTRVETVLPYYERFLARFPTVEDLAAAPVEEVLALWSGLGYYRRARQLHAAARQVAARGEGFPRTAAALLELPGIGGYTAAAVASIAFGEPVPVLDGNVERVVARLLAFAGDAKSGPARRRFLEEAAALLDPRRPGDSNQALMELGATLCTPRAPRCLLCPLRAGGDRGTPGDRREGEDGCRGAAAGDPERFPAPRKRREPERVRLAVAVVGGPGVLLYRRPEGSALLAGTWELPWVELEGEEAVPGARLSARFARRYGGRWALGPELARVRHGITFRDLDVAVHRGTVEGGGEVREGLEAGWFDREQRGALPLSSLVGKVLARVDA